MKKVFLMLFVLLLSVNAFAQTGGGAKEKSAAPEKKAETKAETKAEPKTEIKADAKAVDFAALAKAALAAHGGDKFKQMKSLIVRGSADVSGSPTQTFPATFAMVFAGDRYRYEISNPFQPFKQIYDGDQTYSSVPNFTLPPINRLGLPLLQRLDEKGFMLAALPEKSKKKNGFRITSPEGFFTDFFVDEKTGQIKSYEASYDFNGRSVTTSVDIDRIREVDGVKVPEKYAQRLELGFATIYVEFKAKEILVNSAVEDNVFTMAN